MGAFTSGLKDVQHINVPVTLKTALGCQPNHCLRLENI